MPTYLLGLFAKRGFVMLAVILMLAACLTAQSARLSHAKADVARARLALVDPLTRRPWREEAAAAARALGVCAASREMLVRTLEQQNRAFESFKEASAQASTRAAQAIASARRASTSERQRARQALAATPGPNACASADAVILQSLG